MFSKWSLSTAVLFCESNIFVSYPSAFALAAAVSAKNTNHGLFNVDTTMAIFFGFSFSLPPLLQAVKTKREQNANKKESKVIFFI